MSTQLSFDDLSPLSKGQLSYDLAAALGMKSIPFSSFQSIAGLDSYASGSGSYPSRSNAYPPAYPSAAYQFFNDQQSAFLNLPAALSGGNLALHDALSDPYVSSQFQQRPPSPQMQYPVRWPATDAYPHYPIAPVNINAALAQSMSMLPPQAPTSVSPQSTYQSLPPDAHRSAAQPAWSVAGSLDPVTGVFQRASEHPRLRTAQACEKCRIRKAKCSGEHPSCQRCRARGLLCEYSPERRMRGPNKNKRKNLSISERRSATPNSDRRFSIVSASSSSSELDPSYCFPEMPPPIATAATLPMDDRHSPSPNGHFLHPQSYASETPSPLRFPVPDSLGPLSPHTPQTSDSPARRPRPPPLHLGDAAFFPSVHIHHAQLTPEPMLHTTVIDDITATYAARRASLPAYLLNAAHSPAQPAIGASPLYSHSRSNSTSDGSVPAPLTPLSLPDSMLGMHGELSYPDDFHIDMHVEHNHIMGGDEHSVDVKSLMQQEAPIPAGTIATEEPHDEAAR